MKKFFSEFKEFIMRGNVLDLAVGVIIGAAFQAIVTSLTSDIISPILGIFGAVSTLTSFRLQSTAQQLCTVSLSQR